MRSLMSWSISALKLLAVLGLTNIADAAAPKAPTTVIFDTDVHFDDVIALAMLHTLSDRGELDILGVTISNDISGVPPPNGRIAAFVDVVNTFYGRGDLPVGIMREGTDDPVVKEFAAKPDNDARTGKWLSYARHVAELKNADGSPVFPHDLTSNDQAEDAVPLLRRLLAGEQDGSVVLLQLGYSTNFARLLDSKADAISPLTGRELIKRKVPVLSAMAGRFAAITIKGEVSPAGLPETNLRIDTAAAQKLFAEWPTSIVAGGFEIGYGMQFSSTILDSDLAYAKRHPILEAYSHLVSTHTGSAGRPTWLTALKTCDPASVLYTARPDRGYFSLSEPGTISVLRGGGSDFEPNKSGLHRYLIQNDEQRARTLEAIVMLMTQPPVHQEQTLSPGAVSK